MGLVGDPCLSFEVERFDEDEDDDNDCSLTAEPAAVDMNDEDLALEAIAEPSKQSKNLSCWLQGIELGFVYIVPLMFLFDANE